MPFNNANKGSLYGYILSRANALRVCCLEKQKDQVRRPRRFRSDDKNRAGLTDGILQFPAIAPTVSKPPPATET